MFKEALTSVSAGKPVLIHDSISRENETDIVFASQFATPEAIRFMRKNGGGMICVTIREKDASRIGLDYVGNMLLLKDREILFSGDVRYDRTSPFSLWINSRNTFTGISDIDRSATIVGFSEFIEKLPSYNGSAISKFSGMFRVPGHVPVIIARDGYFRVRKGHTELSTYLMERAGLIPSATVVEMIGDDGRSMSPNEARAFAEKHSLTFIEGSEIIKAWSDDEGYGNGGL